MPWSLSIQHFMPGPNTLDKSKYPRAFQTLQIPPFFKEFFMINPTFLCENKDILNLKNIP